MIKKTAVIFESFAGKIRLPSWEALTCAIEVNSGNADEIQLILLGEKPETLAQQITNTSGWNVTAIETGKGGFYNSARYKTILTDLFKEQGTTHICLAGTTQGLDYAPGLAIRMDAECITGVEGVFQAGEHLGFMRSIHGGKIVAKLSIKAPKAVIVTQPGTFKPFADTDVSPGIVDLRTASAEENPTRNIEVKQVQKESSALAEASIIVSAGRGFKEEENLDLIRQLAAVFTKSAVAGSRPLCDLGWLEYSQQIGITGAMVAPDMYLACGISGAAQHISGMRNAGFIVSINADPNAAIFNYSDVCIVEDLITFIPTMIETFAKLKTN